MTPEDVPRQNKRVCSPFLFSHAAISSRPNPSRRSRPNFMSSVLLSSVISIEKRERNGLQAVYIYVKSMHEVYREYAKYLRTCPLIKIVVSVSLLALDSNRVARTSRAFKIGIERELVCFL